MTTQSDGTRRDSRDEGDVAVEALRVGPASDWLTDLVARAATRELGQEPAPTRILGHHRAALLGSTAYEVAVRRFGAVEGRFRKLASLQAARISGCPW